MAASGGISGLALVVLWLSSQPADAATMQASQSVSVYQEGNGASVPASTTVGYTALASSGLRWRWRGALSWWRWHPENASGLPADAGVAALNLTAGRSLWRFHSVRGASRGWVQLKATIPLDDQPSPVSSGRFDWGFSLLTTNRIGGFFVFAELGYLNPGDPVGVAYQSELSGAVSVSWHRRGLRVYPLASFISASPVVAGDPNYGEWSAGLGASLGAHVGLVGLYSHGTSSTSPGRGVTAIVTVRL